MTGASSGIGRAVVLALAGRGARVWAVGRKLETLGELEQDARDVPGSVESLVCDLTDDDQVRGLATSAGSQLAGLDVLVHAAGVHSMGAIESASVDELDWQYRSNVRAVYLLTQALLPLLRASRADVVFVNSSAGLRSRAVVGQYSATKHALKAIADTLRQEVNASGIRVLSVYPGRTASPLQESVHRHEGLAYRPELLLQPEDVASVVLAALDLSRTAEVTDVSVRPFVGGQR